MLYPTPRADFARARGFFTSFLFMLHKKRNKIFTFGVKKDGGISCNRVFRAV